MKTEFNVGDRVRHKASGREAIISFVYRRCAVHSSFPCCGSVVRPVSDDCDFQPNGRFDVSFDFGDDLEDVAGFLLEKVIDEKIES